MNIKEIKFLLIDDDPMVKKTVSEILKAEGCESVTECNNGAEGFQILQDQPINFIICDWEMPVMDGFEFLKKLRMIKQYKDLPFMMITSPIRNEELKIEDAGLQGADSYLIKPFRARMLMQKIKEVYDDQIQKSKKAVILADDDDMAREFVAEVLKGMEFSPVHQFNKASDAYQFLEKNFEKVALVVSDWEMPVMTGIEFLHKIRINRLLSDMPFIMITSQTSVEHLKVQKAIQADVDNYLMKPFNVEALQTKVKLVLTQVKLDLAIKRALENAVAAMADSDWHEAEQYFHHVKALDPKNIDALLGLASVELKREHSRNFEEAVRYFRTAIAINPKYDRPHIELALAYEGSMALDKATHCLKEALSWVTSPEKICYHYGRLLIRRGKNEEGVIQLEKALELNPQLEDAREILKGMHKEK